MAYFDESIEPENYESKCLCVLVVDTSSSMGDPNFNPTPIEELNDGIKYFFEDIISDYITSQRLELSIITFNDKVVCLREPSLVENYDIKPLKASGTTKMVDAIREAMEKVEERKQWYKKTHQPYYRPWIILITDGAPDQDQDINSLALEIKIGSNEKKFTFYALGVNDADMNVLNTISTDGIPPSKLLGIRFREFFKWLSTSLSVVTNSSDISQKDSNEEAWKDGFFIKESTDF